MALDVANSLIKFILWRKTIGALVFALLLAALAALDILLHHNQLPHIPRINSFFFVCQLLKLGLFPIFF